MCALHCDGTPHRGAADADGVVASAARRRKVRTYPEIVGPRSWARLVVLAVEVGGRWSSETRSFIAQLGKARSRQEPSLLRRRAEQAWRMRWGAFLSCVAAKAVASSLLESRCAQGADAVSFSSVDLIDVVKVFHSCASEKKKLRIPFRTLCSSIPVFSQMKQASTRSSSISQYIHIKHDVINRSLSYLCRYFVFALARQHVPTNLGSHSSTNCLSSLTFAL